MQKLKKQDLFHYFRRINFQGSIDLTIDTLNTLHERHVFSIPFEGINAYAKLGIKLDLKSIFNKLVMEKRGGYCYEMNGLFYSILTALGFDAKLHLAEVVYNGAKFRSQPPKHSLLIVKINEIDYLVDVGYGRNGLIRPIPLHSESTQEVYSSAFQLDYSKQDGYVYQFKINDIFLPEYRFDYPTESLRLEDLSPYNDWTLASSESSFVQHAIITKPTKLGRVSLIDKEIRLINNNELEKISITSLAEYTSTLEKEFNIKLASKVIKSLAYKLKFRSIKNK